jgi:hypothetical protein
MSVLRVQKYIYIGTENTAVYLYRYLEYTSLFISELKVQQYIYIGTESTTVYLYRY